MPSATIQPHLARSGDRSEPGEKLLKASEAFVITVLHCGNQFDVHLQATTSEARISDKWSPRQPQIAGIARFSLPAILVKCRGAPRGAPSASRTSTSGVAAADLRPNVIRPARPALAIVIRPIEICEGLTGRKKLSASMSCRS